MTNTSEDDNNYEKQLMALEHEISELIRNDNGCTTYFTWNFKNNTFPYTGSNIKISVHTYNPVHKTKFLLMSNVLLVEEITEKKIYSAKFALLKQVKTYVEERKKLNLNYLVEWNSKNTLNENVKHSYFNGENIDEILEKFYNGREKSKFIIYKIEMIPES